MKISVIPFVLAVALLPGPLEAQSAPSEARIDAVVRAVMERQKIPGTAVAVIHKGSLLLAKGYGEANVEHRVPVTSDTIFQSGSVGKQFTAAVIMLLVEQGTLGLDDPLTKYFPEGPAHWREIRIRHLLTHTSGIPDYTGGSIDYRKDHSEDDLLRMAYGQT